jgi:hypothetical protein
MLSQLRQHLLSTIQQRKDNIIHTLVTTDNKKKKYHFTNKALDQSSPPWKVNDVDLFLSSQNIDQDFRQVSTTDDLHRSAK